MSRNRFFCAVTAGVFALSSGAMAANKETILSHVSSPVMVNQGEAYVEAQEGMLLYPGDQLMVMNGGSAQINYANGCVSKMASNEVARVSSSDALCNTPASAGTNQQISSTGTTTSGGGSSAAGGMSDNMKLGLGVLAVGGAYAAADSSSGGGNNRPDISP